MGENQGMIWIILGVILVAGVLMLLGGTMKSTVGGVNDDVIAKGGTGELSSTIDA